MTTQMRNRLWQLFNSRTVYFVTTAIGVIVAFLDWFSSHFPVVFSRILSDVPPPVSAPLRSVAVHVLDIQISQTFMQGVVQSFIASLWFAWTVYLNRRRIQRFLQPPSIRVLAPMSIAITPIIVGQEKNIWEDSGINLELDFSATGKRALEDLKSDKCAIAIAGDYALCSFFKSKGFSKEPYKVLPFALLKNQVKLLAPPASMVGATGRSRAETLARLKQPPTEPTAAEANPPERLKIAYWPDSIHAELVRKEQLHCACLNRDTNVPDARTAADQENVESRAHESVQSDYHTDVESKDDDKEHKNDEKQGGQNRNTPLLNFMSLTASGKAEACILVEPYFIAFQNAGYDVLVQPKSMSWYMCLVMKKQTLKEYPDLERRLLRSISIACAEVHKRWRGAMHSSAPFMLRELTGIDENSLVDHFNEDNVIFEIPTEAEFDKRLEELYSYQGTVGEGASVLQSCEDCIIRE